MYELAYTEDDDGTEMAGLGMGTSAAGMGWGRGGYLGAGWDGDGG